jgi:hypothetical protein
MQIPGKVSLDLPSSIRVPPRAIAALNWSEIHSRELSPLALGIPPAACGSGEENAKAREDKPQRHKEHEGEQIEG